MVSNTHTIHTTLNKTEHICHRYPFCRPVSYCYSLSLIYQYQKFVIFIQGEILQHNQEHYWVLNSVYYVLNH